MYYLLMIYKKREGTVDVPVNHIEDGWKLGEWLSDQRALYQKRILNPIHQERLEEAGVAWNLQERNWEIMLTLLQQFKDREGHVLVPQRHQEDGKKLGEWLNWQRTVHKNGRLSSDRQKLLEDMGVAWNPQDAKFDKMCALLAKYQQRENNVDVPITHKEGDDNLGFWLASQRKFLKRGSLSAARQEQLKELGVDAGTSQHQAWKNMLQLLVEFKARERHTNVPMGHQERGFNLGYWVNRQRAYGRKGRLSPYQKKELEDLGFTWDVYKEKWDRNCSLLKKFMEREGGDVKVPLSHEEAGVKLGRWLSIQRRNMKNGSLSPERQQQLEDLGVTRSEVYKNK